MPCLRRSLHIKRDEVREDKITNIIVRSKLIDIGSIQTIIAKRRLLSLGKIIRMPCNCILARLITAFLKNTSFDLT